MVSFWQPKGFVGRVVYYLLIILLADTLVIGLATLVAGQNFFGSYSYYTLFFLEGAVLLFTGAISQRGKGVISQMPVEVFKKRQGVSSDWALFVTGVILLASGIILAYYLR